MTRAARETVDSLMPRLKADLARLVGIPSVSEWGFPEHTRPALLQAYQAVVELFRDAGVDSFGLIELEGTAPVITGEIPGPEGAPTVLLYGHYDVVSAGDEALWTSPPYEASERDGAIYGRGTADSKSNILVHVGALRAFGGRPPVGVKLLLEGQEEVGSPLEEGYPAENPGPFRADAILVADGGSIRAGQPSLTVSLRGDARITVEVRTLASNKHSGQYGGAAPDALIVLLSALATLWDERGDVAVEGLRREEWDGETYTDDEFRALAEIDEGLPLLGTGGLGSRIWTGGGDHRARDRCARRRGCASFRAGSGAGRAQRPGAPGAARRGGTGGRDPPSRGAASVRRAARDDRGSNRGRLPGAVQRARLGRDGVCDERRLGGGDRSDRDGRSNSAREGHERWRAGRDDVRVRHR
jgi:acetylornithine deacetylase/succinyl-diaminopimelate desuccinylase-like protein